MWIFTTAGHLQVEVEHGDVLQIVALDKQSIDALADGVELVAGGPRPEVVAVGGGFYAMVSRADFAAYIDHEIFNYLTYTDFQEASKAALGHGWDVTER